MPASVSDEPALGTLRVAEVIWPFASRVSAMLAPIPWPRPTAALAGAVAFGNRRLVGLTDTEGLLQLPVGGGLPLALELP